MNRSKQGPSETEQQKLATQFRESYMYPRKTHPSRNHGKSECPVCHEHAYGIVETRFHKDSQTKRRRRDCSLCHYRVTTYEITSDQYQEYLKLKKGGAPE